MACNCATLPNPAQPLYLNYVTGSNGCGCTSNDCTVPCDPCTYNEESSTKYIEEAGELILDLYQSMVKRAVSLDSYKAKQCEYLAARVILLRNAGILNPSDCEILSLIHSEFLW